MNECEKIRLSISCASEAGMDGITRDDYGFRHGERIVLYENSLPSCHEATGIPFLACAADSQTQIQRPHNPQEDAAPAAVWHLLYEQYENYFDDDLKYHMADAVNESVIRQAAYLGYDLSASLAAVGICDKHVRTMYFGNCSILHIHQGKLSRLTPLKMSNFNSTYVGNDMLSGRQMAVFHDYPLCKGDTWILASDGVTDPLTDLDYELDDDMIMHIVKNNPLNCAQLLVKVSGETYDPCYTRNLCKDSRTAVVIHIEET